MEHTPSAKTDATAAFLASLEEPKLTSLSEAGKKPPIEILPPGMSALSASITVKKKPAPVMQTSQPQSKPLALEAPPTGPADAPIGGGPPSASAAVPDTPIGAPPSDAPAATPSTPIGAATPDAPAMAATGAAPTSEASEPALVEEAPNSSTGSNPDLIASAEMNPSTSASDTEVPDSTVINKPLAEVPPVTPDNQETSISSTLTTSQPFV